MEHNDRQYYGAEARAEELRQAALAGRVYVWWIDLPRW
jgi:hypothetical protein